MKYTDRFIKLPISIFDIKLTQLTGKEEVTDSFTKVIPGNIESYRPSMAAGGDIHHLDCTFLRLKSGDELLVKMPIDEFERALCDHGKDL